jgi:GNAT superfamily N-acetyltransferase
VNTPLTLDEVAREPARFTARLRAGDGSPFVARVLLGDDADALGHYFDGLSQSVRSMYGPHPLNAEHAAKLCAHIDYRRLLPFLALVDSDPQDTLPQGEFPTQDYPPQDAAPAESPIREFRGAVCRETHKPQDVAGYFLIRPGLRDGDRKRYVGHGHPLVDDECCTFAPCVADAWQQRGLGSALFPHVAACLRRLGRRRLVLWGGVRGDNPRGQHFYRKFGFRHVGDFADGGVTNLDMVLDL